MVVFLLLLATLFGSSAATGRDLGDGSWKPEEWRHYAQRPALMPHMERSVEAGTLIASSTGEFRVDGAWRKAFPVESGAYYKIHAEYRGTKVALPRRSILVKIDWIDAQDKRIFQPDYPEVREAVKDGWESIEGVYAAPEGAVSAVVDLVFRWDRSGRVEWKDVTLTPATSPPSRNVRIATVNFRPRNSSGPDENLKLFGEHVAAAAAQGADIICLPEGMTLVGTGKTYLDVAEPIPGPSTRALGQIARRYSVYVVAGLIEKDGQTSYNTAVLIGRDGQVAGKYRKVALPREEIEGGLTPGEDYPVFTTDFGTIGIMICWDLSFPEAARQLAQRGAEIILMPIWGGIEPLFPARAIENGIYLVSSSYDAPTGIWDPRGNLIAEAAENGSIALHSVDLEERTLWEWLGDFRARIPREAPPVQEVRP